jgi:hypothetical protein
VFSEMRDGNPPTTPQAITEFERSRGLILPSRYKEFLLTANGGRPEASAFPIERMALNPLGAVHFFFGLNATLSVYDLARTFDWFRDRIPSGIVLIASTDGADYVCLDLRNGQERVAFWDQRHYWGTGEWRESDLHHVANSFADFLASLRPNPY